MQKSNGRYDVKGKMYILKYFNKTTKEEFTARFLSDDYDEAIEFAEDYIKEIREDFPEEKWIVIELIQIQSINTDLKHI